MLFYKYKMCHSLQYTKNIHVPHNVLRNATTEVWFVCARM